MREPGYYWVKTWGDPFIARWSGAGWLSRLPDKGVTVLSERIPAAGELCTCEAAKRARWRPIEEWTEDMGWVLLTEKCEPGIMRFDYPDEASLIRHGWTHFCQPIPIDLAEKLKGGQ